MYHDSIGLVDADRGHFVQAVHVHALTVDDFTGCHHVSKGYGRSLAGVDGNLFAFSFDDNICAIAMKDVDSLTDRSRIDGDYTLLFCLVLHQPTVLSTLELNLVDYESQ